MIYINLFLTFAKIGLVTFGGGYAMISFIFDEVVTKHHWITSSEFTDLIAISQVTPGPIGINSATYVGFAVTGNFWGSLAATTGAVLPSFVIILTICKLYDHFKKNKIFESAMKGIRPVVIGLIGAAALLLINKDNFTDWKSWIIFGVAFSAVQWLKQDPILVIVLSGVVGFFLY
jgi:chromate transporter